jgi:hypothetical protein
MVTRAYGGSGCLTRGRHEREKAEGITDQDNSNGKTPVTPSYSYTTPLPHVSTTSQNTVTS